MRGAIVTGMREDGTMTVAGTGIWMVTDGETNTGTGMTTNEGIGTTTGEIGTGTATGTATGLVTGTVIETVTEIVTGIADQDTVDPGQQ